jgi:hypothetical protein
VKGSAHDGFVYINVTVPDFQIETAFRIGTNPRFVLDIGALAAKIRQGHKVSGFATLTLGEIRLFHGTPPPNQIQVFYSIHLNNRNGNIPNVFIERAPITWIRGITY